MLTKIINNKMSTFYFQIWKNRFRVTNVKSGYFYEDTPLVAIDATTNHNNLIAIGQNASAYSNAHNPFSHPRIVVDDFETASIFFRHALEQVSQKRVFFSPLGVIQVMDRQETELTPIEKKALIEISLEAGCRECLIFEGKYLDTQNFNFNELKQKLNQLQ